MCLCVCVWVCLTDPSRSGHRRLPGPPSLQPTDETPRVNGQIYPIMYPCKTRIKKECENRTTTGVTRAGPSKGSPSPGALSPGAAPYFGFFGHIMSIYLKTMNGTGETPPRSPQGPQEFYPPTRGHSSPRSTFGGDGRAASPPTIWSRTAWCLSSGPTSPLPLAKKGMGSHPSAHHSHTHKPACQQHTCLSVVALPLSLDGHAFRRPGRLESIIPCL